MREVLKPYLGQRVQFCGIFAKRGECKALLRSTKNSLIQIVMILPAIALLDGKACPIHHCWIRVRKGDIRSVRTGSMVAFEGMVTSYGKITQHGFGSVDYGFSMVNAINGRFPFQELDEVLDWLDFVDYERQTDERSLLA